MIVDPGSGDIGLPNVVSIPLDDDHLTICKPSSRDALVYLRTKAFVDHNLMRQPAHYPPKSDATIPPLKPVRVSRPRNYGPIALRLGVLVLVGLITYKGVGALLYPPNPLDPITEAQITRVLRDQLAGQSEEVFARTLDAIKSIKTAPGSEAAAADINITVDQALAEVKKNKFELAKGILLQIFENEGRDEVTARRNRANAARHLAAVINLKNTTEALDWYRKAANLDPTSMENWRDLGDTALSAGKTEEAEHAYRTYLSLAESGANVREQMVANNKLGNIYFYKGNLREASRAYGNGLEIAKRRLAAKPNDPETLADLAKAYQLVGFGQQSAGTLAEARFAFEEAVSYSKIFTTLTPNSVDAKRLLSLSYQSLSTVLRMQGRFSSARESMDKSFAIREQMAAEAPKDNRTKRELAESLSAMGRVFATEGNLPEAVRAERQSFEIRQALVKENSSNAGDRRDLSISYSNLGEMLIDEGNLQAAHVAHEDNFQIAKNLADEDPNNTQSQRDISVSYRNLGRILRLEGNLAAATKAYESRHDLLKKLIEGDASHALLRDDLSSSFLILSEIEIEKGNLHKAKEYSNIIMNIAQQLFKIDFI